MNLSDWLLLHFVDSVQSFSLSQLPLSPSNETPFTWLWWGSKTLPLTAEDFEKSREEEIP